MSGARWWGHCEAVWFADMVCAGVPHGAPDETLTFDAILELSDRTPGDDFVMTLVRAAAVERCGYDLLSLRREILRIARPFIERNERVWGQRFVAAVRSGDVDNHDVWASRGSGAVMALGGLATPETSDVSLAVAVASTHLNAEAMVAGVALVHGLNAAARSKSAGTIVDAICDGVRPGEVAASEVLKLLGRPSGNGRSVLSAVKLAANRGDLAELVDDENDYTSARYVLACGVRAFLAALSRPGDEVVRLVESAGRSGDPDTSAVVAIALLQAFRPQLVSRQIDALAKKCRFGSFEEFLLTGDFGSLAPTP